MKSDQCSIVLRVKLDTGFFRTMTVSDQPRDEVDKEIINTTMAGMVDVEDILELTVDGFNNGARFQQQSVLVLGF